MAPEKPILGEEPQPQALSARLRAVLAPDILSRRKSTHRLGKTAWLDGLRGWAALCVVIMHLTVYTHEGLELCYGAKFRHADQYNTSPIALPILRLPFTGGHFSVMLFFTISGYVVPRRLIQHLQEGKTGKTEFLESLQSAMVRRPVRLYLPVYLSTFVVLVSWYLFRLNPPWPIRQSNIVLELVNWLRESSVFSYFFRTGWLYTTYNVHSWTIPVELRGSIFLFVYLLAVHTVSTRNRVILTLLMTLHLSIGSPGAWYACFFAGMFLSELDLIKNNENLNITFPWDGIDRWIRSRNLRGVLLHVLLLISLYLATQPSADWWTKQETLGTCPGWKTLSHLIPTRYVDLDSQFRWFWLFWAAWSMLYAVREIPWLRACFETRWAQYLGKHSFSLYLIHGPMIGIYSEKLFYLTGVKKISSDEQRARYTWYENRLLDQPWWPLPDGGPVYGLEPNFLFCVVASLPVFLYVAEIGTRVFDEPSNSASRWVWQKWKTL